MLTNLKIPDLSGRSLRKLFLPALLVAALSVYSQSNDKAKLNQLKTTFDAKHVAAQKRVAQALAKSQTSKLKTIDGKSDSTLQKRYKDKDGRIHELVDVRANGTLVYYVTNNAGAASTIKTSTLYPGGSLGLNLTGAGEEVAIWDAGHVRTSHELFGGRAYKIDVAAEEDAHSTHVGGTMIGGGNVQNGKARGMAYEGKLLSYEWNNDVAEAADAVANRNLLLSNHSYGWGVDPWTPLYVFGKYMQYAADWDAIHEAAPYYLQVKAAGNPRYMMNIAHPEREGFDVLTDFSVCKNNMVVAAVEEGTYTGPSSVKMSSFSGYGPTDDGRIKPDISAKGVHTFSAINDSDNSYDYYDGTSMASPSVSGSLLLLQQYYKQQTGSYLKAATLKGIALHTASEAGNAPGPDYRFGWGLLNMQDAALAIKNRGTSSIVKENTLAQSQVYTYQIVATNTNPLVVSICWTDPAGVPNESEIENERAAILVNDLDARVFDGSLEYKPWVLNPFKPNDAAKRGDNLVDNIEKIEILPTYIGQVFTIRVSHKGTLKNGSQNYSLIITGGKEASTTCITPAWRPDVAYTAGTEVSQNGLKYKAKWWTLNESPATNSSQWAVWALQGPCGDNNQAPAVSIAAPLASATITGLNPVLIRFNASDADGSISKVFAKITDQLGTVYYPVPKVGSAYDLSYTPRAYGTFIITAVAVDNLNKPSETTLVQKVWETVTTPSLTIVSPANGSIAYVGLNNLISIKAAGTVNKNMGVFISGANFTLAQTRLPGEGPDYTYVFIPDISLLNQTATLKVEVRDLGNNSVVLSKTLNLLIKQNILPTIEVLSSKDTLLNDIVTWKIRARANDADGTVSKVILRYFDGNDLFKMELTKTGNVWTGDYVPYFAPIWDDMQAYSVDNLGEESVHEKVTVRVASPGVSNPPLVFINAPQDQQVLTQTLDTKIHLNVGTYNAFVEGPEYIIQTRVYLDDVQIITVNWDKKVGTAMNEDFYVNSFGPHALRVETTDERGLVGSASITFTVNPPGPEISFISPANEATIYTGPVNPQATIEVDVNDEVVTIDSVRFIVVDSYARYGNVRRFTLTEAPFTLNFVPALDAFRTELIAIAFSNGVGMGTENRIVYYRPDIHPAISILTPTEGEEFFVDPANLPNINVTVDVNDEAIKIDSIIYTIEDIVNSQQVRSFKVFDAPFSLSYQAVIGSRERIYATAFGNRGRYSISAVRTIYIRQNSTGCTLPVWDMNAVYVAGNEVQYNSIRYKAKWWTQNNNPASFSGPWDVWQNMGTCTGSARASHAELENTSATRTYPNPSTGMFTLESGMTEAYSISVQNMSGKEVLNVENIQTPSYSVNLAGEAKGIYVIKITSGSVVAVQQLVIE